MFKYNSQSNYAHTCVNTSKQRQCKRDWGLIPVWSFFFPSFAPFSYTHNCHRKQKYKCVTCNEPIMIFCEVTRSNWLAVAQEHANHSFDNKLADAHRSADHYRSTNTQRYFFFFFFFLWQIDYMYSTFSEIKRRESNVAHCVKVDQKKKGERNLILIPSRDLNWLKNISFQVFN